MQLFGHVVHRGTLTFGLGEHTIQILGQAVSQRTHLFHVQGRNQPALDQLKAADVIRAAGGYRGDSVRQQSHLGLQFRNRRPKVFHSLPVVFPHRLQSGAREAEQISGRHLGLESPEDSLGTFMEVSQFSWCAFHRMLDDPLEQQSGQLEQRFIARLVGLYVTADGDHGSAR